MNDLMLLGVLRMPHEMWSDDVIDVVQRHSRYVEAANRIEADAARIKELEVAVERFMWMY